MATLSAVLNPSWGAEPYAAFEPLAIDEMENLRGGFVTVFGATVAFGAEVRTLVDGNLVLQTTLNQTPTGLVHNETYSPGAVQPGTTVIQFGGGNPSLSSVAPNLSAFDGTEGLILTDASGVTTTLYQLGTSGSGIVSGIANTASGRDVEQHVNVTVTLSDFGVFADNMRLETIRMGIENSYSEWRGATGN
ncbi:MAG: hypothetical protein ACTS3R_16660 [Inquilinaceae bacterium]